MKHLSIAFMTCSAVENDAATDACWFQTTPKYGLYPGGEQITGRDGKPVKNATIVLDKKSTDKIMEAFRAAVSAPGCPGILVDQDHFSCDTDKPTTALAWAKEIRRAEDGSLWTRWEFTAKGKELYEGKMLVNRSPVMLLEEVKARGEGEQRNSTSAVHLKPSPMFAPYALESIGMTNKPYFKDLSPLAAARDKGLQELTDDQMKARCKNWGLICELAVCSAGYDEAKHPRAEDGKWTDGSGSVTPAKELVKKSSSDLAKINPWDDEKTRKMKLKLQKMHEGNEALRKENEARKQQLASIREELTRGYADLHMKKK